MHSVSRSAADEKSATGLGLTTAAGRVPKSASGFSISVAAFLTVVGGALLSVLLLTSPSARRAVVGAAPSPAVR